MDANHRKKPLWLVVAIALVVVSLVMFGLSEMGVSLPLIGGYGCKAPAGYQEIGSVNAIQMDGTSIWIARAIVPTGEDRGGSSVTIRGCKSSEKALKPFGGLYVYIDDKLIYIESGLKGEVVSLARAE